MSASGRSRLAALILLAAIAAVFLVQTYGKAYRETGNDFTSYLLSAEALVERGNPYDTSSPFPYVYPAFLAALLVPMTLAPYGVAVFLWFVASVVALLLAVRLAVSLCGSTWGTLWGAHLAWPLTICALLLLSPIQNNLLNGQVNFLVLLLCLAFVADLASGHGPRASIWLALATAIKILPAVFLIYLLRRRRYGIALATVVSTAVFLLAPAAFAGWHLVGLQVEKAREWAPAVVDPPAFPGDYPPFGLAGVAGGLVPALRDNAAVVLISALIVLGVLFIVDSRRRDPRAAQLYLLAMLLVSPWSEKHHLAFMMPAAVVSTLAVTRTAGWVTRSSGWMLVGFWVTLVLGNRVTGVPLHFASVVILFVLLARRWRDTAGPR